MATPTYSEALQKINTYIVANGNNEITANVLNPILKIMLDFANNTIGNLEDLTTDEKENIVAAINSLKENIENINTNSVQLYTEVYNPNTTPPASFKYADFYMQLDFSTSEPIKLWQWNGFEWKDYSDVPSTDSDNVENNSTVTGSSVTDALNTLAASSLQVPKISFTADGITATYNIESLAQIKAVFIDNAMILDESWEQNGTEFTLTFIPDENSIIKPI